MPCVRWPMWSHHGRLGLALAIPLLVAACGGSPQGATPTPTVVLGAIDHPTGADEVVLRFDEAGGFVPVEFLLAHMPIFTLYGDGTIVFQGIAIPMVPPREGDPAVGQPLRTAKLSEEQVQALLEFALGDGGLAAARERYDNPFVADAPTAVFEIHAAGGSKTVSVVALGLDSTPNADSATLASLVRLAERLRNFDQGGTLPSAAYEPRLYRGVLLDAAGGVGRIRPWPWPNLAPDDFALPEDPNTLQQRIRVLSADEAAMLGVDGHAGGIQAGLFMQGPDGIVYSLVLRPLLPDEEA